VVEFQAKLAGDVITGSEDPPFAMPDANVAVVPPTRDALPDPVEGVDVPAAAPLKSHLATRSANAKFVCIAKAMIDAAKQFNNRSNRILIIKLSPVQNSLIFPKKLSATAAKVLAFGGRT